MKNLSAGDYLGSINHKIETCLDNPKLRLTPNAFIRKSTLGAKNILGIILNRVYRATQLEIDDYFEKIGGEPVSKQAFSQGRIKVNPDFLRELFDEGVEGLMQDDTLQLWKNMRVISIDGSTAAVENSEDLIEKFGCSGSDKSAATARISIAHGAYDDIIYDARISPYSVGERDLAIEHVERLCELGLQGNLLLFDRGYPSVNFIAFLIDSGFHFVMRVKSKWNLEVDAVETQDRFIFTQNDKKYEFRAINVTLPNGEKEVLLTTLNQKKLRRDEAKDLYFKRWRVEVAYDLLKSKLQLENFSGKTFITVLQDFWATMVLGNLVAIFAALADEQITENDKGKKLKNPRRADRNRTIDKLRKRFVKLFTEPNPKKRKAEMDDIVEQISKYAVACETGRTHKRKTPRSKRFHCNRKPVV